MAPRMDLAARCPERQLRALHRPLSRVQVGVGLIQIDDVGVFDHERRHVRMHVQRDADHGLVAHDAPQRRQDRSIHVLVIDADTRPVQVQEDGIPGTPGCQLRRQVVHDGREHLVGDEAHRQDRRRHQRHKVDIAIDPRRIDEASAR